MRERKRTEVVVRIPRALDPLDVLLIEQRVDRLFDVGHARLETRLELLDRLVDQLLVLERLARLHDAARAKGCRRSLGQ